MPNVGQPHLTKENKKRQPPSLRWHYFCRLQQSIGSKATIQVLPIIITDKGRILLKVASLLEPRVEAHGDFNPTSQTTATQFLEKIVFVYYRPIIFFKTTRINQTKIQILRNYYVNFNFKPLGFDAPLKEAGLSSSSYRFLWGIYYPIETPSNLSFESHWHRS